MPTTARFRTSIAWQKAMDLATTVYGVTNVFPQQETFGLTTQLRRASVSIASNIAEGQGRTTIGEIIQFLGMARGSLQEVQTQLELASRLKMGIDTEIEAAQDQAAEVAIILNAAITTMRARLATRNKKTSPTKP
jgi:four helix bundle protein